MHYQFIKVFTPFIASDKKVTDEPSDNIDGVADEPSENIDGVADEPSDNIDAVADEPSDNIDVVAEEYKTGEHGHGLIRTPHKS